MVIAGDAQVQQLARDALVPGVLDGRCGAAHFQHDQVAAPDEVLVAHAEGGQCVAVAAGTAGQERKPGRQHLLNVHQEIAAGLKAHLNPIPECLAAAVSPEPRIADRRQALTVLLLKAFPAMAAGAGPPVRVENPVVAHQAVNAGLREQLLQVLPVSRPEGGIVHAILLGVVSRQIHRLARLHIEHPPVVQAGAVELQGRGKLVGRVERDMVPVAAPDVQGLLPAARTMGEHRRMVVKQHDLPLVELIGNKPEQVVQASPDGHEIPAKVRTEDDAAVDPAGRATVGPPPDLLHQCLVGPGQVLPGQPPAHGAVARLVLLILLARAGELSRLRDRTVPSERRQSTGRYRHSAERLHEGPPRPVSSGGEPDWPGEV